MFLLTETNIGRALLITLLLATFFAILAFPIYDFIKTKMKSKSLGINAGMGTIA